jgi:hypothetical protein
VRGPKELAKKIELKGGKIRYVPMTPELAGELRKVHDGDRGGSYLPAKVGR